METCHISPTVQPGMKKIKLTKEEAERAVFIYAVGRQPTDDEMERLEIDIRKDHYPGLDEPWTLQLILEDHPPVIVPSDKNND